MLLDGIWTPEIEFIDNEKGVVAVFDSCTSIMIRLLGLEKGQLMTSVQW